MDHKELYSDVMLFSKSKKLILCLDNIIIEEMILKYLHWSFFILCREMWIRSVRFVSRYFQI